MVEVYFDILNNRRHSRVW